MSRPKLSDSGSTKLGVWLPVDTYIQFAKLCQRLDVKHSEQARTLIERWIKQVRAIERAKHPR